MDFMLYASEMRLVSEEWQCGGTADVIAVDAAGEYHLIDIKTSSGVYAEMKIQCAAYEKMVNDHLFELPGKKSVVESHIIQVPRGGGDFHHIELDKDTLKTCRKIFCMLLSIHYYHKEVK